MNSPKLLRPLPASLVLALTAGSLLAPASHAQSQSDEWKFRANVYAWLPSLDGETRFEGSDAPDEPVDIERILDSIEGAFMGGVAAEKGQWGIFSDYIYLDLSDSTNGNLSFGNDRIPANLEYKTTLGITGWVWNTAGSYTLVDQPLYTLKLLGGVRFLDLEEEFKWDLASEINDVPVGSRTGKIRVKDNFADAIIGVRGRVKLGDSNWSAPYYLDVGAGQTDFTLQTAVGINYAFESVDLSLSYRYLEWEFESGKALQSLNFSGMQIGLGYRW